MCVCIYILSLFAKIYNLKNVHKSCFLLCYYHVYIVFCASGLFFKLFLNLVNITQPQFDLRLIGKHSEKT